MKVTRTVTIEFDTDQVAAEFNLDDSAEEIAERLQEFAVELSADPNMILDALDYFNY